MPDFKKPMTVNGVGIEPALGNPSSNGYLLSSTTAGVRSWVAPSSGTLSGTGTTGRMTEWGGTNTIQASTLAKTGAGVLTLSVDTTQTFTLANTNVFIGPSAGSAGGSGGSNIAIGTSAGAANTVGADWAGIGSFAGAGNVSGNGWFAFGSAAGQSNTSGSNWVAFGTAAGFANVSGSSWIAIGRGSAHDATVADFVTVGYNAGYFLAGDRTVAIGYEAGYQAGARCVMVGFRAGYNETGNDKLYIENTNSTRPLIGGDFTADTVTLSADWSATSTISTQLTLDGNSTGTPAAGFGNRVLFNLTSSTTVSRNAADWSASWATATDASRKARMVGTVYDTAAREWIRGEADGSNPLIGFLGASAVARQSITGDRQGNAALASLLTGLVNEGLVTDSTTSATPTYTPTYVGGSSAGSTTYTSQTGVYRQVGSMVFFSAKVVWTAASGTGNARVSIPSTAANVSNQDFAVSVYHTLVTFANGSVVGRIQPNTAYIEFLSPATNAAGTAVAVEAAGTIVVSGFYLV